MQADVTKEESVTEAVDKIIEEAGAIHGMVCNAGRTNHKSALDFTKEEVEELFSVNVGLSLGVQVLNLMLENGLRRGTLGLKCVLMRYSCLEHFTVRELLPGRSSNSISKAQLSSRPQWPHTDPTKYFSPPPHLPIPQLTNTASTLSTLRRLKGRYTKHDAHAGHGMGTIRHPRK